MQLEKDFTVKFDSFDISTIDWFYPTSRLPNNMPDVSISTIDLVRSDGAVVVNHKFTKKVITIFGYILAPTRQSYEEAYDELKFRLSSKERILSIVQSGTERLYTASLTLLVESFISDGKTYLTMTFECYDPFGRDTSITSYTSDAITDATSNLTHVFDSYVDVYPKATITIGSITGGTSKNIYFGNRVTGQQIKISRTFAANDVIVIDSSTQEVSVNGSVVDFTGFFPVFQPKTAYAQYSDDFTTRSVTIKIEYTKKYL